jgi:pyruvate dehydrogenase E1 component
MPKTDRKVWAFLGDGELDEPETVGALALAGREHLDNLVFVINANLQRLDGPVRGNGKIIQEAESVFRGAGWNVIKVVWGSEWDPLLAQDHDGELKRIMLETVDGEYQAYKTHGAAYTREHFFGKSDSTRKLADTLSDHQIAALQRGGLDPAKVYAAYHEAIHTQGRPTVIIAKTIKGYGLGEQLQSQNANHNKKKVDIKALRDLRDRLSIPISDEQLEQVPYFHPGPDSPEVQHLRERRAALGGSLPQRRRKSNLSIPAPDLSAFSALLESSGDREISTTMAMVRTINILLRDAQVGPRVVPVIADEARTFGMEGLFRQVGIYAPFGQRYTPNDSSQLVYYREKEDGQVLQEGISEAGGISAWIAAATSYSVNDQPMLPFFLYYAMFGFQRVGDLAWAAADMRARGFLVGGTAGRTTINGEGLQHEDAHSHLMSGAIPNVVSYDPTFQYEVAVIIREGVRRMLQEQEDVYFYLTVMNENYRHPAMPEGAEEGILRGMYLLAPSTLGADAPRVQLLGAGTILREAIAAAEMLRDDFGVAADVWSAPSFSELRRDGFQVERWNRLHPEATPRVPYITALLEERPGPVIAATDYVRAVADQVRAFMPEGRRYTVLGTDGFGRSDTRWNLRAYFEVDRRWIAHAAVSSLVRDGALPADAIAKATQLYGIDADKEEPALG